MIDHYPRLRRDLMLAVEPRFFGRIEGTTDSELLIFLALTFGLDEDSLPALERMAWICRGIGYVSNDARDVRQLYPEDERLQHLSDEARAVVSELLADLPGLRREVPPSSAAIMQPGDDHEVPLTPYARD